MYNKTKGDLKMVGKYEIGEKVWVLCAWVDEDCWVEGAIVGFTEKRIKVDNSVRGVGNYKPDHVKKAAA